MSSNSQNFLIGPVKDGVRRDVKPWAIPEDSYEVLTNAYQFRGRVVRRQGYTRLGELPNGLPVMGLKTKENFGINDQTLIAFDTTESFEFASGTFSLLPSTMTTVWSGTDYQFFYTANYANAFWATNSKAGLHGATIINITQAAVAAGTPLVTTSAPHGFTVGQTVVFINVGDMVEINGLSALITSTPAANTFSIDIDTSAFTGYTSNGFALNSSISVTGQDGIRFYSDSLTSGVGWVNYNPPVDTNNALVGALLIFAYRGYLVFLNTQEGNEQGINTFVNRARWTQIGTPYYSEPVPNVNSTQGVDVNAARDDLFGRGGANDAPTDQPIVGAGFVRDTLIVYFSRSTWILRFVNNAQNPFIWERVNVELGSDCTGSTVIFDQGMMAISNRGMVIGDTNGTRRIDEKIPEEIFNIRQSNFGFQRVQGIRSFDNKLNYWTIPSDRNPDGTYPDELLVLNYDTMTWAKFDDVFTCFGYYYPVSDVVETWADLTDPWSSYGDLLWESGNSSDGFETIVAGNQQGYVVQLETTSSINSPTLSISAIVGTTFTSTANNMPDGSWVTLTGITGTTNSDGSSLNGRSYKVSNPTNAADDFSLNEYEPVYGGDASGVLYLYQIDYVPIIPGSVQINIGVLEYVDSSLDGVLYVSGVAGGTIDYLTGTIVINLPAIAATPVYIRVVSYNPGQVLVPVDTTGAYGNSGEITKISGIDIQTKYFNFFGQDKKTRLHRIDCYMKTTSQGQLTCNLFGDSSNLPINTPLSDNYQSNIIETSTNPYQVGVGDATIYRLFCEAVASTIQMQFTLSDRQMAVPSIVNSDIEIYALMVMGRPAGRLI